MNTTDRKPLADRLRLWSRICTEERAALLTEAARELDRLRAEVDRLTRRLRGESDGED